MKLELYMRHIFQEYPVTESIQLASDTGWRKYERNCGCRGNVAMLPMDLERPSIQGVFLREEDFGGLLYDPATSMIHKLDKEAFELVGKLVSLDDISELRREPQVAALVAKRIGAGQETVEALLDYLREAFLW